MHGSRRSMHKLLVAQVSCLVGGGTGSELSFGVPTSQTSIAGTKTASLSRHQCPCIFNLRTWDDLWWSGDTRAHLQCVHLPPEPHDGLDDG